MNYSDFDRFDSQYVISGKLTLNSALNIGGADMSDTSDNPVAKILINGLEVPYIPGSSLKGILRTEVERILRTVDRVCEPPNTCDLDNDQFDQYCPVCGIFGGMGLASHLRLQDALPMDENVVVGSKPGVAINRTLGTAQKGALYNLEIVHPKQSFEFKMIIDNIDLFSDSGEFSNIDIRSKAIKYILTRLMAGHLSIGKKSSSGLGDVILENVFVTRITFSEDSENFLEEKYFKIDFKESKLIVEGI